MINIKHGTGFQDGCMIQIPLHYHNQWLGKSMRQFDWVKVCSKMGCETIWQKNVELFRERTGICSLGWEEWRKTWSSILLSILTWMIFLICGTSGPFLEPHGHCTLCSLCHAFLCIQNDGLKCIGWSCWQMPDKCHMQLPSGSALYGCG